MSNECPHCHKPQCVIPMAFVDVEQYGSRVFTLRCRFCCKPITVSISRYVKCDFIKKSEDKPEFSSMEQS